MRFFKLHQGHVLTTLQAMPAESVQCVVTSPPYFGLRNYGTEPQVWGSVECQHVWHEAIRPALTGGTNQNGKADNPDGCTYRSVPKTLHATCSLCGAWRGELGLEPTLELFIDHLVEIFREVRRVLRSDGVCWLNMGDSYASGGRGSNDRHTLKMGRGTAQAPALGRKLPPIGYKPKDLLSVPWLLAFALRADGWHLRSDCIWHKPNALPESVTDRPTKAHEYVFLLTKSADYFYDRHAIAEPTKNESFERVGRAVGSDHKNLTVPGQPQHSMHRARQNGAGYPIPVLANKRTVWTIATQARPEDHYAAFPDQLVETCILAGTSEVGCCSICAAPFRRLLKPSEAYEKHLGKSYHDHGDDGQRGMMQAKHDEFKSVNAEYVTIGWESTCKHPIRQPVPCTVLDPFTGRGTVGIVSLRLNRSFVGCELKPDYVKLATDNIINDAPLLNREQVA